MTKQTKKDNYFKIYSQNAQGLRSGEDKIEYIICLMDKKKIDAFLIQEMHLEGDYMKQLPGGKILIHHGPETQPKQGAKGRVAIIWSAEMDKAWKRAGMKVRKGRTTVGKTTRLLGVDIEVKTLVKWKTKNHIKHQKIMLVTRGVVASNKHNFLMFNVIFSFSFH